MCLLAPEKGELGKAAFHRESHTFPQLLLLQLFCCKGVSSRSGSTSPATSALSLLLQPPNGPRDVDTESPKILLDDQWCESRERGAALHPLALHSSWHLLGALTPSTWIRMLWVGVGIGRSHCLWGQDQSGCSRCGLKQWASFGSGHGGATLRRGQAGC